MSASAALRGRSGMGILGGKKKPKPEEVYAAVKVNNMETLADLLSKGCDPNGHLDAMVGRGPLRWLDLGPPSRPRSHRRQHCGVRAAR